MSQKRFYDYENRSVYIRNENQKNVINKNQKSDQAADKEPGHFFKCLLSDYNRQVAVKQLF